MKSVVKLLMAGLVATCCRVATGRTENVNGVKWSYSNLSNHCAGVTSVDPGKKTALAIPYKLGGRRVNQINSWAFAECSNLVEVAIPWRVTNIGDEAFCYCISLTSVIIGANVSGLGKEAFVGCTAPESVTSGQVSACTGFRSRCPSAACRSRSDGIRPRSPRSHAPSVRCSG